MEVNDLRRRLAALIENKLTDLEGSDEVNAKELQILASTLRALGQVKNEGEDAEAARVKENALLGWDVPEDLQEPVEHADVEPTPTTPYVPLTKAQVRRILKSRNTPIDLEETIARLRPRCPDFPWDEVTWDYKACSVRFGPSSRERPESGDNKAAIPK